MEHSGQTSSIAYVSFPPPDSFAVLSRAYDSTDAFSSPQYPPVHARSDMSNNDFKRTPAHQEWAPDPAWWPVHHWHVQRPSQWELSPSSLASAFPCSADSQPRDPPESYPESCDPPTSQSLKACAHCAVTSTPLWRRERGTGELLCNACGLYLLQRNVPRPLSLIEADMGPLSVNAQIPDYEYSGPMCSNCRTRVTSVWRKNIRGLVVCNACGVWERLKGGARPIELRRDNIKPRTRHARKVFRLK
ncbi:unnamed protein product [Mycena citricolor]|uniref:GATA-type domain-containing protein n=1 Tax=Mycena citricolor TaxID=2018698 RepID=A0AAD2H391_9AGAR|nr:unnamed protein product [Mycena citricolor]